MSFVSSKLFESSFFNIFFFTCTTNHNKSLAVVIDFVFKNIRSLKDRVHPAYLYTIGPFSEFIDAVLGMLAGESRYEKTHEVAYHQRCLLTPKMIHRLAVTPRHGSPGTDIVGVMGAIAIAMRVGEGQEDVNGEVLVQM
ncbi:hypothetical protein ACJX0J_012833, partial [Zea mays]